jgi:predicted DNA-binding protein (UPF0251 family)
MITGVPGCRLFKPAGVPARELEEIVLLLDELEAMRLADFEGLYQEEAAERMHVSRPTFGRIVESARRKIARALLEGQAIRIEGGVVQMTEKRTFTCQGCRHDWEVPFGVGRPAECPGCKSRNIRRADTEREPHGPAGGRQRRCRQSGMRHEDT